ncbi:Serine/threonine-protein kinase AFC3 [Apostasia shenzhenica]|uniref:Serine/threonine-protein kinase AFC3 n=1 Tax=Apostasia shenzhenica TaxID=1088818 RepID=A0A2I0A2Y9_9ASPA|nr:Serine/threonine-protein kinase AFC3 [Apostasia shenzhenica]
MEEALLPDVLDFLTRHGFSGAASALRDDAVSRGLDLSSSAAGDGDDGSLPPLPPVRTTPSSRCGGGGTEEPCSSSSSSASDFVSIGSSPSELRNPYGICSPALPGSSDSSGRHSEFATARGYHEHNLFADTGWYGDEYAGYFNDADLLPANSSGWQSEDKFVMSIEAEESFMKQETNSWDYGMKPDNRVCLASDDVYGCSFPLCDCCKRHAGEKIKALNPSSSIYGKYRIMDDETERLEECEEDGAQLKLVDEITGTSPLVSNSANLCQEKEDKVLDSRQVEKNMDEISTFPFPVTNPSFKQNNGGSSDDFSKARLSDNINSKVFVEEDIDERPFGWEAVELEEQNDDYDSGNTDSIGAGGEDRGSADDLQLFTAHDDEFDVFDLKIIHRRNRTGFEENKDFQIVLNSVIAGRYYVTEYLGSAAFSRVVQAHDLHTGVDVCLKIIKNDKDFFDQSLDEIKLLKFVNKHDPADKRHILRLYDYFYHQEHLFIVCELLRANLYEFQKFNQDSGGDTYFTLHRIQVTARQCLKALEYLHHLNIIHCDLKPENILIKSYSRCEIKVIDLGSSCFMTDNLCLYVQSRSYRAPEVILGLPYDEKIDLWSLGCILAELYTGDPEPVCFLPR